ncbi:hypothetical protein D9613_005383 [Agrocybe pediades]|uniref:Uncharacterized protein n=1 Tax=Agrocybe pediades TaxID=84607 RepID=A0A8H4QYB2_9AGAR|nr:hypothetical protein D9613_005383 [Agrocybe pediades]
MQRSASPFRAPSPFNPQATANKQYPPYPSQLPTGIAQVGPGATTYTTTIGPDGRPIYIPYKAVAASYHTPSGVVSGIQWVPQDPTSIMPSASSQHVPFPGASEPNKWNGAAYTSSSASYKDDHRGAPDRPRPDDKRRGADERRRSVDAKRDYEDQSNKGDPEYELLLARERDAKATAERNRRPSFNAGSLASSAPMAFPAPGVTKSDYSAHPAPYPPQPYPSYGMINPPAAPSYPPGAFGHTRSAGGSVHDISRQFKDMDLERTREQVERAGKPASAMHGRSYSASTGSAEPYGRPRAVSGNFGERPIPYPSPPNSYTPSTGYTNPVPPNYAPPYPTSSYIAPSPNMRPQDTSFGIANATGYPTANASYAGSSARPMNEMMQRSTTPHGPPPAQSYSHSYGGEAPQPNFSNKPRSRAPSRAPSPNPEPYLGRATSAPSQIGKSPRARAGSIHVPSQSQPPQQLPAPEAFSRPINAANPFTPFEMMKIQDMEEIYDPKLPKMPSILTTHDIYPEDWKRCMQDLGRSWTGQLPVPTLGQGGRPPKRSTLTADLVDLWNASFFFPRGVELILYKGRERRTGPQAGHIDTRLAHYDETDDSSSSSSESDSDDSDYERRMTDPYGRPIGGQGGMAALQEARRRRQERKQEKKRRRKEKKARRKAKARDKTYTVYIACTPGGPPLPFIGRPPAGPLGYNTTQAGQVPSAGYIPSSYGAPVGIPTTRSHGYGGGY